jgi:ATP-dependent Clp protease ATP-binding subunit ClpA
MYERFTDRSRRVMQLANQEAQRFNHEYIGTEHILLGLIKEGSGVAANVLKNLDIDLRKIRTEIEKIVQHGPGGEGFFTGRLPHTPRAQKVIEYAIAEARRLKHNYVGTEHLLLGLLREDEGVAAQVLLNLGLKLDTVRAAVMNLLENKLPERPEGALRKTEETIAKLQEAIAKANPDSLIDLDEPKLIEEKSEVPTERDLRLVRDRIRQLRDQIETAVAEQNFELAANLRDEAVALKRITTWCERNRPQP